MITVFTQNCALINISDFNTIMYAHDEEKDEHMVVLDDKYILGRYKMEEIPDVISWIGSSISSKKTDENVCLVMPMSNTKEVEDAKND